MSGKLYFLEVFFTKRPSPAPRCVAVSVVVAHVDVSGLHVAAHGQQGVQWVRLQLQLHLARPLLAAQPEVAVHGRVVAAVTRVLARCKHYVDSKYVDISSSYVEMSSSCRYKGPGRVQHYVDKVDITHDIYAPGSAWPRCARPPGPECQ